jgi:hypothetical protein
MRIRLERRLLGATALVVGAQALAQRLRGRGGGEFLYGCWLARHIGWRLRRTLKRQLAVRWLEALRRI